MRRPSGRLGAWLAWAAGPVSDFAVGRRDPARILAKTESFRLISHRGGRPHNTLEGVKASCAGGRHDVELDLRQTSDGAWVCWHDSDLMRSAGSPRAVAELTLPSLRRLLRRRGRTLTTLEELLAGAPAAARLWLDVKGWTRPRAARELAALVRPLAREKRIVVISYSEAFLSAARAADRDLDLGCLTIWRRRCVERAVALRARALLPLAIQPGLRGLIRAGRAAGLEVYPYTVDGAAFAARMASWDASGVVTNDA